MELESRGFFAPKALSIAKGALFSISLDDVSPNRSRYVARRHIGWRVLFSRTIGLGELLLSFLADHGSKGPEDHLSRISFSSEVTGFVEEGQGDSTLRGLADSEENDALFGLDGGTTSPLGACPLFAKNGDTQGRTTRLNDSGHGR